MTVDNFCCFPKDNLTKNLTKYINSCKVYKNAVLNPTAYILGGQSGSGKSTIHQIVLDNDPNHIVIDGNRFRERHPYFKEIQNKYGRDAANYTQPFVNQMVERLIERLSNERYNLIIEGMCRLFSVPLKTCKLLKSKGYTVNLAVMCTNKEIAWQSTVDRYNARWKPADFCREPFRGVNMTK